MARKMFVHRFVVEGSATFPVDMLRYDSCYPASSESAVALLEHHTEPTYFDIRKVELNTIYHKDWMPTERRWASFGWKVLKHEIGHEVN